jgi:hypothetical protein
MPVACSLMKIVAGVSKNLLLIRFFLLALFVLLATENNSQFKRNTNKMGVCLRMRGKWRS